VIPHKRRSARDSEHETLTLRRRFSNTCKASQRGEDKKRRQSSTARTTLLGWWGMFYLRTTRFRRDMNQQNSTDKEKTLATLLREANNVGSLRPTQILKTFLKNVTFILQDWITVTLLWNQSGIKYANYMHCRKNVWNEICQCNCQREAKTVATCNSDPFPHEVSQRLRF